MNYLKIGKIVNTHGIKGEIRILSDFEFKNKVFVKDFKIYIGPSYEEKIIASYRHHKEYEMITMKDLDNINQVLIYKGQDVYIDRDFLLLKDNEYLLQDLIGLTIIEGDETLGIIQDIVYNKGNILLSVGGLKEFYIPSHPNFIKEVKLKEKIVKVENAKDLIIWKLTY